MAEGILTHTYDFRGQSVRYGVTGAGPPIVLVHGTPFSSHVWHRVVPYLAAHRQVFLYDLPGYGRSEQRDGQDVSLGVQNEVLAELLDHWRLDRPEIVGHDFGGTTVLRAHLLNGREFRRVTLIDPVVFAPWGTRIGRAVKGHESGFAALPPELHRALVTAYVHGAVRREMSEAELRPYLRPWLGRRGQAAFYRQIAQFDQGFTDEVESRYDEVRAPTLILWGEEDRWLPIAHGRRLARIIPGARFQAVPGSGHLVHEDAPEAIIVALRCASRGT